MVTLTESRDLDRQGTAGRDRGSRELGPGHRRGSVASPARASPPPCSTVAGAGVAPGVRRRRLKWRHATSSGRGTRRCSALSRSDDGRPVRSRTRRPRLHHHRSTDYCSECHGPALHRVHRAGTHALRLRAARPGPARRPGRGRHRRAHLDRQPGRGCGRRRRPGPRRSARADPSAGTQVLPGPPGPPGVTDEFGGRRRPGRLHGRRLRVAELPAQGPVVPGVRLRHRGAQGDRRLPRDRAQPRRAGGRTAGRPDHRGRPRAPPARRRDVRPAGQAPEPPDPPPARGSGAAAGGRAVGRGDRAGGPVHARRRAGHAAPRAGPAAEDPPGRIGGPRDRGRRAVPRRARRGHLPEVAAETDDTCADPAGLEELDIDPDVAAADDSAIDAMAAVFFAEPEAEPVVAVPAPRRPTPYKRAPSVSC